MHRNARGGLAEKSVAYEIPRGGIARVWSPQFLSLRHRIHSRSSHALSAVVVIPILMPHSSLLHYCTALFRPYMRGIILL